MRIMVIGGGGREHALIRKLKESPRVAALYALPGNGGIAEDAICVPIGATDINAIVAFAREKGVDFAVVAPDDPLVLGAVDALNAAGIRCFGPDKKAAHIEGSKAFAKDLMARYGIPTASYRAFDALEPALEYLKECSYPIVVKADGLALGKGVIIARAMEEAEAAVASMMRDGIFGESGRRVVLEEYLEGPEVTVLAFADGKTLAPMLSSMDHKRALDGDQGLNTGGMGVIAPNPYYTADIAAVCMDTILLPTLRAMREEGRPFHGCLYFGLMLTADGPKVIEYNCRFGDPEAQAVLSLLETDLLTILEATENGTLDQVAISFKPGASCCVMTVSGGYPQAYQKGLPIKIGALPEGVTLFHSGTAKGEDGRLVTSGGRVIGVTAVADTLEEAVRTAYQAAPAIEFTDAYYRRDIGRRAMEAL